MLCLLFLYLHICVCACALYINITDLKGSLGLFIFISQNSLNHRRTLCSKWVSGIWGIKRTEVRQQDHSSWRLDTRGAEGLRPTEETLMKSGGCGPRLVGLSCCTYTLHGQEQDPYFTSAYLHHLPKNSGKNSVLYEIQDILVCASKTKALFCFHSKTAKCTIWWRASYTHTHTHAHSQFRLFKQWFSLLLIPPTNMEMLTAILVSMKTTKSLTCIH